MRTVFTSHPDDNQGGLVKNLRKAGASILILERNARGCPDFLMGYRFIDQLVEVKQPGEKPTPSQYDWHRRWHGRPVVVIRTLDDGLAVLSQMASASRQNIKEGRP